MSIEAIKSEKPHTGEAGKLENKFIEFGKLLLRVPEINKFHSEGEGKEYFYATDIVGVKFLKQPEERVGSESMVLSYNKRDGTSAEQITKLILKRNMKPNKIHWLSIKFRPGEAFMCSNTDFFYRDIEEYVEAALIDRRRRVR